MYAVWTLQKSKKSIFWNISYEDDDMELKLGRKMSCNVWVPVKQEKCEISDKKVGKDVEVTFCDIYIQRRKSV